MWVDVNNYFFLGWWIHRVTGRGPSKGSTIRETSTATSLLQQKERYPRSCRLQSATSPRWTLKFFTYTQTVFSYPLKNNLRYMSEKTCAVCGKILEPSEIRIDERRFQSGMRKKRYLCRSCRQKEYNNYMNSIKKLIEKKWYALEAYLSSLWS